MLSQHSETIYAEKFAKLCNAIWENHKNRLDVHDVQDRKVFYDLYKLKVCYDVAQIQIWSGL